MKPSDGRDIGPPTLNRPLVLIAISFWLGVLAVALGWVSSFAGVLVVAGLSLLVWRVIPERFRYAHFPIALLFLFTGAFTWSIRHSGSEGDAVQHFALAHSEDTVYTLTGRVERSDIFLPGDDYAQCYLRVDTVELEDEERLMAGGVLIRWSKANAPLFHSERITVQGKVVPTVNRSNHGVRGVEEHHRLNGVHSSVRISGTEAVIRHGDYRKISLGYWASRLRQDIAEHLAQVVPESARGFVLTVWLGDRRRVAGEAYTSFLESGTAHILAVSGVHIGLIYMTVSSLLRLLIRSPRRRIVLTLFAVALFAFMAGARISSLRAAIMIGLYLMAEWVDREPDAPTALSLAALIFGIHNPDVIFMPGFQLSFLSIASILLFRPLIRNGLVRLPHGLANAMATTLSVQLVPLPAAVLAFHIIPLAGIVLNMLIIPLLSIVLWLAFLTTLTLYLIPPIAPWFAHALVPFVGGIEMLAQWVAQLSWSHRYLSSPSTVSIVAYCVALGLVWWWMRRPKHSRRALPMAFVCAFVCWLCWTPSTVEPQVTFLDVGHGDAAVVHTTDQKTILVDGGNANDYLDMGQQVVAPYLWSHHVNEIEAIFVSHADSDHLGGLTYILEHFPVAMVYTSPALAQSIEGRALLTVCDNTQTPVKTLVKGDTLRIGKAHIQVIHPPLSGLESLNDNDGSLVFTLESAGVRTLFTGDIEKIAEAIIFADHQVNVDVLKVPHHGSNTSSSSILFDATQAQHAIVSSGQRRGKPLARPEVLQRYRDTGIEVHRSDYSGSIRVHRQGDELRVSHAREKQGIPVR